MKEELKVLALRFVRGFVASFIGACVLIVPNNIDTLTDLQGWLTSMAFAGLVAGISGGILALDKAIRYKQ